MPPLVVTENFSLEGIASPMDGWFDPSDADPELAAVGREHREAADTLVLGRVTFTEFAGFWPHQHDDPTGVAAYLDQADKYVLSTTLTDTDWQRTTILRGPAHEELATLKTQAERGKDIVITGSIEVVRCACDGRVGRRSARPAPRSGQTARSSGTLAEHQPR